MPLSHRYMRPSRPAPHFLSYCPGNTLPLAANEKFVRSVAPRQCSSVFCGCEDPGASCALPHYHAALFLRVEYPFMFSCFVASANSGTLLRPAFHFYFYVSRRHVSDSACVFLLAERPNRLAAVLILRFPPIMISANNAGSKLCAEVPRHATHLRLSAGAVAQLGKGRGVAPPRCIPSPGPQAAPETGLVSVGFARWALPVFVAWEGLP